MNMTYMMDEHNSLDYHFWWHICISKILVEWQVIPDCEKSIQKTHYEV